MEHCTALALSLVAVLNGQVAGEDVRVVRANSTTVDIQDGNRLLHGGWIIHPDVELDTYYCRRANSVRKVTFRTDIESITFDVMPGRHYDFVVLLNGNQKCPTRISTLHEPCRVEGAPDVPCEGVIPFSIGRDLKIHIEGRINGSAPLDLLFDTGADTLALYPSGLAKGSHIRIDGTVKNDGIGGVITCSTSIDNCVEFGTFRWDHESIALIDKQVDQADGIIGHNLFEDKVVEIDYDARLLRLSEAVPERTRSWTTLPIRFNGTLPALQAQIETGPGHFTEWLILDTGSDLSVHLNRRSAEIHYLHRAMKHLGSSSAGGTGDGIIRNEIVLLPRLILGKEELRDLPIYVEEPSGSAPESSSRLGMDVLKRFNMVLDFRNNMAYLSPSSLYDDQYRSSPDSSVWKVVLAIAVVSLLLTGILWRWRRFVLRPKVRPTKGLSDNIA